MKFVKLAILAGSFCVTPLWAADAKAPTESADQLVFDNWAVNCQTIGTAPNTKKICEAIESIVVEGQKDPLARIAIGKIDPSQPWHLTVLLPTNISLPSVVHATGPSRLSDITLNWTRCLTGACFAEAPLPDALLKTWRAETTEGKVTFVDARGQTVGFPMSFKGLTLALDTAEKAR